MPAERGRPSSTRSVDPAEQPISDLAPLVGSGALASEDLVRACLDRIAARGHALNAFISVWADAALEAARDADREIAAGRCRGALHGIPISIKDMIDVRGEPTTAGSRARGGHLAAEDAPVVARLREAGAILIGKTNLHEFAFGTTNEDSAFGPARNPHAPERSPGGSSGGSAAAVAAGMCAGSVGTDTGGSIRIPAAACGIVGLKPDAGDLSCRGVVPLSPSLDHIGPLARTVEDAWILFDAMSGVADAAPGHARKGPLRLGLLGGYFLDRLDEEVRGAFGHALKRLSRAGHEVEEISLPHAGEIAAIYLHLVLPEAAAYHASGLEARPHDYTGPVRIRLEMGRYVLAEDYLRAQRARARLRREVDAALAGRDALVLPALAIPAPLIGASSVRIGAVAESVRAITLRLTQLFNLTGHPALAMPCGWTRDRLPCGLQMVGRRGSTRTLLEVALACEPEVSDREGHQGES